MRKELHDTPPPDHLSTRIRKSVFPDPTIPGTDPERRRFLSKTIFLHFRPPTVYEKTLRYTHSWGLGGMTTTLVTLQLLTGILLKFMYDPTPVAAYGSIQALMGQIPFGKFIRNVHYWSANLLVLVAFLHLLRVYFTGAYHPPRQFNWVVGLTMFIVILTANFTGYLLPWDQLSYWAVTVSTSMLEYIPIVGGLISQALRAGNDLGPTTLRMFFAIHTALVPLFIVLLMGIHFWRVRKAKGLVVPRAPEEEPDTNLFRVPTMPHLLLREAVVGLVLLAVVFLLAITIDAPLGDPANPGLSPNPTKAPWYFSGFQELFLHLHPVLAVFVLPALALCAFLLIPYFRYEKNSGGIWFVSQRGRQFAIASMICAILITVVWILADEFLVGIEGMPSAASSLLAKTLFPLGGIIVGVGGFLFWARRKKNLPLNETVQTLFVFFMTSFVVFTIVGSLFRGEGMALIWP